MPKDLCSPTSRFEQVTNYSRCKHLLKQWYFWLFGVKNVVFLIVIASWWQLPDFLSFQYHRGCWRDKALTPHPAHHTIVTPSLLPLWAKKRDRSYSWPLKNRYLSRHLRCTPQSIKQNAASFDSASFKLARFYSVSFKLARFNSASFKQANFDRAYFKGAVSRDFLPFYYFMN